MPIFHIELTTVERQLIEISTDTEEAAHRMVKDRIGRWIEWPSRVLTTKLIRSISTEEWESEKTRGCEKQKQGV